MKDESSSLLILCFLCVFISKVSSWEWNLWASRRHLQRRCCPLPPVSRDTDTEICPCGVLCDTVWLCEVYTHTHSCREWGGLVWTVGECSSQWAVCSPLWWAPHEPTPSFLSSATVLRSQHHTDPTTVSSACDIAETHTHILHGLWAFVFVLLCLCMSVIVCVSLRAVQPAHGLV